MTQPFISPDAVTDRESFFQFVQALVADRKQAELLIKSEPELYRYGGANDWQK